MLQQLLLEVTIIPAIILHITAVILIPITQVTHFILDTTLAGVVIIVIGDIGEAITGVGMGVAGMVAPGIWAIAIGDRLQIELT